MWHFSKNVIAHRNENHRFEIWILWFFFCGLYFYSRSQPQAGNAVFRFCLNAVMLKIISVCPILSFPRAPSGNPLLFHSRFRPTACRNDIWGGIFGKTLINIRKSRFKILQRQSAILSHMCCSQQDYKKIRWQCHMDYANSQRPGAMQNKN